MSAPDVLDAALAFWVIITTCAALTAALVPLAHGVAYLCDAILRATDRPRGATRRPQPTRR